MSRDAILGAIRRGLKRGPVPADQAAMLRGRLASHPRHLIPARSRLPRAGQVALFIRNVEKEFGTVERVPDLLAVPAAVARDRARQAVAALHPGVRRFDYPHRYPVGLERGLYDRRTGLILAARGVDEA